MALPVEDLPVSVWRQKSDFTPENGRRIFMYQELFLHRPGGDRIVYRTRDIARSTEGKLLFRDFETLFTDIRIFSVVDGDELVR